MTAAAFYAAVSIDAEYGSGSDADDRQGNGACRGRTAGLFYRRAIAASLSSIRRGHSQFLTGLDTHVHVPCTFRYPIPTRTGCQDDLRERRLRLWKA